MNLINRAIIKTLFKVSIDKNQVLFIAKLFALSIFADRKVNVLEFNELKRDIDDYVNTYYSMLNHFFKDLLKKYLYEKTLDFLEKIKSDEKFVELYKKEVFHDIKLLKRYDEKRKLSHILTLVKNILEGDMIFTEEERTFFKDIEKLIKE